MKKITAGLFISLDAVVEAPDQWHFPDELHLLVHPIAVRRGMRLFDEGGPSIPLRLISSETFKTGVLNLVFGPAESTDDATYEDAKVHLAKPEQ